MRAGSAPNEMAPTSSRDIRRRGFIVGWAAFGLALGGAEAALALGADAAVLLAPEGRALVLRQFTPAAGPLERYAARPGAWYALLYLPMAPQWPMQLLLWPSERRHDIRLFALDAAPDELPTLVHPLPLELESARGARAAVRVSRFMLPSDSTARAIFVLIEQWHIDGELPAPLSVQLRAQRAPQRDGVPWWSARNGRVAGAAPPPSPLMQEMRGPKSHVVPIFALPAGPDSGVWR